MTTLCPALKTRPISVSYLWLLGLLTILLLWAFSGHIDLHPDEAIYFDAIPNSTRNDSGLFYSCFYSLFTHYVWGPAGARLASCVLGGATFVITAYIFRSIKAQGLIDLLILWLLYTISYQAIFVFDRVRPEAAWWFCSTLLLWAIMNVQVSRSKLGEGLMILAGLLLPMNHRLSWFPCAFFVGYALLFLRKDLGWRYAFNLCFALLAGALLNIAVRAWWADLSILGTFSGALSSPVATPQPLRDFIHLVFVGSPQFLNDTAQNNNSYDWFISGKPVLLSHHFVQNLFWLAMLVLPFLGKTWRQRYLFSFPLFAFFAFWRSGYYNPTYGAGFSLCCVLMLLAACAYMKPPQRWLLKSVLAVSIFNGISYIATRVENHQEANYFSSVAHLHAFVSAQPSLKKIVLPERFTPAIAGLSVSRFVTFKDDFPDDIDVLIIDDYDKLMYTFVPDFDKKKADLERAEKKMCLKETITLPVYQGDTLRTELQVDKQAILTGSWFFRNSVRYRLNIYLKCR